MSSHLEVRQWPAWVAGKAVVSGEIATVTHPGDGSVVGTHVVPSAADVERAAAAAHDVRKAAQATTAAQRASALMHVSSELERRHDEVASLITAENGKPIMLARMEASRAVATFRLAAEEARRWGGEFQRLDTDPAAAGRGALIRRFPYGPVLGISPFNFPLNLGAHKVAPAIAVGAPVVLKPAPATPLSALLLGEILSGSDLPEGMWSILPVGNDAAPGLVADPRFPIVSFTGSEPVGFAIQAAHPRKHVLLELGGNASAIVLGDYSSDADLDWAAGRIALFSNSQAGQTCVAVQRVLVHESVFDRFSAALEAKLATLANGDVWDPATVVGPMITEAAAIRVEEWVQEAVDLGARVVTGGKRSGAFFEPTLLTGVVPTCKVGSEEVFGPVMSIAPITSLDEAIEISNATRFGLQAGVFTHDIQAAFRAQRELEVGGVIIGDAPTYRADQMPYGGIKASGVGREGLRFAMQDYTYDKVMVLTGLDL